MFTWLFFGVFTHRLLSSFASLCRAAVPEAAREARHDLLRGILVEDAVPDGRQLVDGEAVLEDPVLVHLKPFGQNLRAQVSQSPGN